VPPSLGYGSREVEGVIPPDARLIFIIDLLELEKQPAQ
jgi:FKBP-type peptidyl-prolyl cis-trans isomerase